MVRAADPKYGGPRYVRSICAVRTPPKVGVSRMLFQKAALARVKDTPDAHIVAENSIECDVRGVGNHEFAESGFIDLCTHFGEFPEQQDGFLNAVDGTLGRVVTQAGEVVGNPSEVVVSLLGPKDGHLGSGFLRLGRRESSFAKASSLLYVSPVSVASLRRTSAICASSILSNESIALASSVAGSSSRSFATRSSLSLSSIGNSRLEVPLMPEPPNPYPFLQRSQFP